MGLTYFHDPTAIPRSPMLRQLPLCNGSQTGFECQHYWRQVVRMNVMNPGDLRKGQTFRYCKLAINAPDHELAMFIEGDIEMAVECTEYRPDRERKFDAHADDYRPLTPDELLALQEGRAVPRFTRKRWWQFWRKQPKVEVIYLSAAELEQEAQKAMALKLKTSDAPGEGVLGKSVLDDGVLDDHGKHEVSEPPTHVEGTPESEPASSSEPANLVSESSEPTTKEPS